MSSLFYLCFGFIFLKKILKPHFRDGIIALTILAIGLGTNLFYFSTREAVLSHAYNFSLFACFIYLMIRWYEKSSIRRTIGLGILLGLISLIRPTNILILLFFLLYGIGSVREIPGRILFFIKKYPLILLMLLMVFLIWLPQFLYWKSVSGKYLFYSYRDEGFFFQNPQIIKGLFGYRNGWLLYTPMMIFAFLGLPVIYKKLRPFFAGILVFMFFNIWIVLSWWCWWYVGFGNRAFIESYALLAIPLSAFFSIILKKKLFVKIPFFALFVFFVFLNIFQSFQYINGAIHFDSMNKAAYWENFCKTKPTGTYWQLLTKPDYEKAVKGIYRIEQKE
jgi:4-amino-4-deoxy-L-arabinose transferase-like glycosyltransferase